MGGNLMGYLHERLFELGARDVWFTPIQMKKNRPGTMISAIVPSELESQAVDLIMRESSHSRRQGEARSQVRGRARRRRNRYLTGQGRGQGQEAGRSRRRRIARVRILPPDRPGEGPFPSRMSTASSNARPDRPCSDHPEEIEASGPRRLDRPLEDCHPLLLRQVGGCDVQPGLGSDL